MLNSSLIFKEEQYQSLRILTEIPDFHKLEYIEIDLLDPRTQTSNVFKIRVEEPEN